MIFVYLLPYWSNIYFLLAVIISKIILSCRCNNNKFINEKKYIIYACKIHFFILFFSYSIYVHCLFFFFTMLILFIIDYKLIQLVCKLRLWIHLLTLGNIWLLTYYKSNTDAVTVYIYKYVYLDTQLRCGTPSSEYPHRSGGLTVLPKRVT